MLLESSKKVPVPAVANFVFDQATRDRAKIWVSLDAKKLLDGLTGENVPARTLVLGALTERSVDTPILVELGGTEKVAVALAHVVATIEAGLLSKNGWFVAYILVGGKPWALDFRFYSGSGEWVFDVDSVGRQDRWRTDDQFLVPIVEN